MHHFIISEKIASQNKSQIKDLISTLNERETDILLEYLKTEGFSNRPSQAEVLLMYCCLSDKDKIKIISQIKQSYDLINENDLPDSRVLKPDDEKVNQLLQNLIEIVKSKK